MRREIKELNKAEKIAETCDAQNLEELVTKEDGINLESVRLRSYQNYIMTI